MGLFDRFKKKEKKEVKQESLPLILNYSDGTVAEISFKGGVEIEGKYLHKAYATYTKQDGTFEGKSFLLEPITKKDTNGNIIDSTEAYYNWMAQKDGTIEGQQRYNATKGFFKMQEVQKIGRSGDVYIGSVELNQNGEYYRHYDLDFKNKYDYICRREGMKKALQRADEDNFRKKLEQEKYENMQVNIKTSHAEDLSKVQNPYEK